MSIDFEDQLRAEMGRVQVRPRPGLAREAHRRYARSRRRTALAVAATGTAAAVAGATAGFALTAGTPGTGPIETTAYVVNHVSTALAATDAIGYSTARFTGDQLPAGLADARQDWEFGRQFRELTESAAGRPFIDSSSRPAGGSKSVLITVSYPSRDWTRTIVPDSQVYRPDGNDNLCNGTVLGLFGAGAKSAADWKKIIVTGLYCGAFTVDGRQWVDGVDAIRLTGHKTAAHTTIWVDASSYLPVRLTDQVHIVRVGDKKETAATLTIDFRWLPPTRANLKELTAPIPPGFHQVSGPAPRASFNG
jgi:hypothetical protein